VHNVPVANAGEISSSISKEGEMSNEHSIGSYKELIKSVKALIEAAKPFLDDSMVLLTSAVADAQDTLEAAIKDVEIVLDEVTE